MEPEAEEYKAGEPSTVLDNQPLWEKPAYEVIETGCEVTAYVLRK